MNTTESLSDAICDLDTACDEVLGSTFFGNVFDISESDAQGCVLGLHFAIADVLTYRCELTDGSEFEPDMNRDDVWAILCERWGFKPALSRWEPRLDYNEGEFSDDYDQYDREALNYVSTADLVRLGDLCEIAQRAVVAAGMDY